MVGGGLCGRGGGEDRRRGSGGERVVLGGEGRPMGRGEGSGVRGRQKRVRMVTSESAPCHSQFVTGRLVTSRRRREGRGREGKQSSNM